MIFMVDNKSTGSQSSQRQHIKEVLMSTKQVMSWVERLPNVSSEVLAQREAIAAKLEAAAALELEMLVVRNEAYFLACRLESVVNTFYSAEVVEAAKRF